MTRHSLVLAAQSNDPATRSRAIEAIAAAYWRPVYNNVRMKWNIAPEDPADFTHYLNGEPVSAYQEGLLERSGRILARHRTAVVLFAVYLIMRILFILFARR